MLRPLRSLTLPECSVMLRQGHRGLAGGDSGIPLFRKINTVLQTCGRELLLAPPPLPAFGPNPVVGFSIREARGGKTSWGGSWSIGESRPGSGRVRRRKSAKTTGRIQEQYRKTPGRIETLPRRAPAQHQRNTPTYRAGHWPGHPAFPVRGRPSSKWGNAPHKNGGAGPQAACPRAVFGDLSRPRVCG